MEMSAREPSTIGHARWTDAPVPVRDSVPANVWPVELPKQVTEVRIVSQACMTVTLLLGVGVEFTSPRSEPRRWLTSIYSCWPYLFLFWGSLILGVYLVVTCRHDPGYLAPAPAAEAEDTSDATVVIDQANADSEEIESLTAQKPLRWCNVCNFRQPRRSKHCRECGICVRTFDHHCFWIGGCVGEFNHLHFYCMLLVWAVVLIWHWRLLLTCGVTTFNYPIRWVTTNWHVAALIVILFVYLALIVALLIYHTYLIATAQTTWEHMSRESITYLNPFPRTVFPFNQGIARNFIDFFSNRGRGKPHREWHFTWQHGQPIPFNVFENHYYSCC